MSRRGLTITREQLERWAGRPLTEVEVDRLTACVPNSSVPEAIGEICFSFSDMADRDPSVRR